MVTGQAAKMCGPGKCSFDHPASRQQNESSLGLRQFDDTQLDPVLTRRRGWPWSGMALVDISQFNGLAGGLLGGSRDVGQYAPRASCSYPVTHSIEHRAKLYSRGGASSRSNERSGA
jgi:hypothetical protein